MLPALLKAGWAPEQIVEQRSFTAGRIVPVGRGHRRGSGRRSDYLLEPSPGRPLAVIEAKRRYALPGDGLQKAKDYAATLELGFAYSTNGSGIIEHDYDTGLESDRTGFPSPAELDARHRAWRGVADPSQASALALPFNRELRNSDGTVKEPRYYQAIAIDRTVEAALRGQRRMLLTMATGTGKTFVALQTVWKLWNSAWKEGRRPRVLYLADRNILVDQPIVREFQPVFGDAVWKVGGQIKTGREIYFALYQSMGAGTSEIFRDYPADYFDLVIVDECHRGSARADSTWRVLLDHFEPATQLGMTATPLREESADTYRYFGAPLYEYSLAQGIEDGFLAPYQVKRVVLTPDVSGWRPEAGQLDRFGREIPDELYTTSDFERVVSLLERTRAAARHLTEHLRATGRFDKTIVFCVDSEHAEQMRVALHEANVDLARRHPDYVARIVSIEGDVGRERLDDFVDPESDMPVIVTTSRLLSTGVDVPTCKNVVLFRTVGSMAEFKQIIGRGTRLSPEHDKLWFQIVDYAGATRLFADPAFDGVPDLEVEEEVDETGAVVEEEVVAEPSERDDADRLSDERDLDLARHGARKLYVDGGEVLVSAETVQVIDPTTGELRVVSYEDFAREQVRRLYARIGDLKARWRTSSGRDEVVEELRERGVELRSLSAQLGLPADTDAFDALVHLAWQEPLTTRPERAGRVRREHAGFLGQHLPEARAVLEALLDKYAAYGIGELDDLAVLEVPPISALGSPVEIAGRFGGVAELRGAVESLAERIYAA